MLKKFPLPILLIANYQQDSGLNVKQYIWASTQEHAAQSLNFFTNKMAMIEVEYVNGFDYRVHEIPFYNPN